MNPGSSVYLAGHRGMVGSALERKLRTLGYSNLITKTSAELDLREQSAVAAFFKKYKPEYVFLAAAKVGGIMANNNYPADFLYDNLMIQTNVIHHAFLNGARKLLFTGSSCIYPRLAPQPVKEDDLLTGPLEPTNEAYAVAKIAGIKMCEAYRHQHGCHFISVMPPNLYGPHDNYDVNGSHVLPALIRKFHQAKENGEGEVVVWGTGKPKREFMHVDDLADACYFLMQEYDDAAPVNIGTGEDISIADLATLVKDIVGFKGKVLFDTTKPDGTPRKLMDISKLQALGWTASISLADGIRDVYQNHFPADLEKAHSHHSEAFPIRVSNATQGPFHLWPPHR